MKVKTDYIEAWKAQIIEKEHINNLLDKIRAEIDSYCSGNRDRNDGLYIAMKIIDKYKGDKE